MIFKTFDSDIDNMSSRWGMFGKSFSDIGDTITTKWKQVTDYVTVTNDATISGMMSAWKGTSPVQFLSDDSVVNVLNDYNKALDKGAEATAKFFETGTGNDFMNGWLKQLKGAPATMDDYKAAVTKAELAQNGLTVSMVASKVAALALNVAVSMGVSIAISALIKLVDNLVHANEKAIEKAEELRDKYNDFKETNASNVKTLNDLKDEFEELSDGVSQYGDNISLTTEQYARYQEIVQQIVGISPSLAEGYDTENGYIADKNGLLERAIELQEIEYKNELRKITNLDNLKTSMSGYIAEYKEALNGGYVTSEGNIIGTTIDTDFKNSLWEVFNTNNRDSYDGQSMAKDIMESLGVKDINKEIEKYINEYGYWQDSDFWNDYCDKIVSNLDVVTNSLTAEEVGLDDTIFDQNIEKLESYAEQYSDMKDSVKSANESIQTDLGYIAEYADGYSDLSKEQQKFVTDYLKGFDISDITSKNSMGILEYNEDKMASVKSQIKKFVEELSHDDSTKQALTDLYAPPSDNETIEEYKNRIDSALEVIRKYCEANGIEIPVGISDVEDSASGLESSYKQTIENAKEKYGEDLTPFFKENSINTQEEIDKWREIAQSCDTATETKKKYLEADTSQETPISKSITENINDLEDLNKELDKLGTAMANIDDAGNFNLGDLDAVADYFLGLEDIPYNVTEVSNALKTLGDGTSTLEQQKDAINSLADEYLKTSGILDDLNESNAELIQLQLQRMGIENAEEIVNTSLQNEQAVLQQKAQLQQTLIDQGYQLINVTWAEIEAMQNEGIITQQNAQYLAALALQKQIQNGALDESANIANLQALATQMGSTGSTISYWLGIIAHAGSASVADKARENATNAINEALNKFSNTSFKVKVPKAKYNGGSPVANKLSKNNGSGSNSKSKEQKSINEIDLFKRRVDVLNDALELLQKNLDNVTGYDAKNTLLNQSIAITQEEIKNYSDAIQMYSAKASEALSKVPEAYRDAAQNGKVELLTEEVLGSAADENDKTVKELIDSYTGWADSVADAKQKLAELKTELRQLELDKFKNIVEDYSNRTDIFENSQDLINKQIDLFKEAGQVIGEGFYQSLIDEENSKLSLLTEEQQKLIQEMESGISNGTIEKGTDEWNEMLESLNDVNGAILDSKKSIEEFNNSIQQLHWDTIERIKNDFSELSDEINFLYNLLEDDDHVSDNFGNWSDNALAQLGLMAQSYEQHVYASQKLQGEIDELSNAYKRGEYSETEYFEKLYDLKDQQRSEVDASEQAKDSIMSLAKARTDIMVNAINKEIDSMSELIDKKKEALSAEKSLHEYRKSIEESSNNIAKIEQQLAAMQGDDTASTIAKRKKLEEELANAKKEREEQEYSHSIEAQQDALDQQLEDFKESKNAEIESLQQYLENQEQVIFDAFEIIKQNTETVASSISLIAQDHGYQVSNTLTSSWAAGENAITSYNQVITDASSIFAQNLTAMQNAEWSLQQQANATAISVASVYTVSAQNLLNELTTSYVAESNLKTMTDALRDSLITCLDRGYNIGSLVTQLHGVADAASSAASSVNDLMNAFAGAGSSGTYQYGTGNTVYYYDSNGQKHITSKSQAENAGYTAPTSDRPDLLKKKTKKTSKKAKGGLITKKSAGSFDSIAKSIGEDHMIAVKDNETVLTPVQTQGWLKLIDNLDAYNKSLQPDIIKPNIPKNSNIPNSTVTLNYDHLIEVQGDVNNSNIKDIENAVINSVNEQIKQFTTALKRVGVR